MCFLERFFDLGRVSLIFLCKNPCGLQNSPVCDQPEKKQILSHPPSNHKVTVFPVKYCVKIPNI